MEGRYSARKIAFVTACLSMGLMILMFFVPNYLGVAGDQTVGRVMNSSGVYYTKTDIADIYNNYFVWTYSNVLKEQETADEFLNSQVILVRIAVFLDNLITGDKVFDIRFLALLYGILYVPAVYLLVLQACSRVNSFSEGSVIGFVGLLIFADVAYLTYFNSFYPEALWFICLLYCVAAGLSFQENRSAVQDFGALFVLVVFSSVLMTSRGECAFLGVVFAVFCLKLLFARKNWMWGVICVMTAFLLSLLSISCMINMQSDQALQEEFLSQYTYMDVAAYYVRHPGSFVNLMDVFIKSCFGIRKESCDNYEQSVGLPAQAKSIFWGAWSTFKNTSAPKTIGYLLVLIGAVLLLFGRGYSIRPDEDRRSTVFLDMMMVVVLICVLQSGNTIIHSGDAEMVQHCFLISLGIDIITYFVFAELVHKIKIF